MVNPMRGEVALVLDGQPHVARLTLGALAELEQGLDDANSSGAGLNGLVARMDEGRFASRDILAVLVAGLRGGGWQGQAGDLMAVQIEGGPLEAARIAARLLALAFRAPE
ncbi:gene transfer agent family protein [Paracoccus nototheniae]|uniref:Gene transfer agent family protein n=1 Tax=Paracoccus nototheniae TaxID=2489002 RepID=A0ABW4DXE8_9RHOB|nr:gene transfer agent family protein [Paracoccus nototheniae]